MPFKSEAQRKWFYENKPDLATKWEKETPKGKLPKHVKAKGASNVQSKRNSPKRNT
jgi:hypothetical protein